ncbi:cysteine desulfurase NifS [Candidatus Calescamantes bacterium]|nr:cysteine desulfurase NifS [Candidatus Calescamantes bacterium]
MRRVYMDHNATCPMDERVIEAMIPYFEEKFGNASSLHSFGREARDAVEKAREEVARLLNAEPQEIIFTSGGTESNNLAIKGYCWRNRERGNHIITTKIEHHAVLNPVKQLEKEGFRVTYLPVDKYGRVDLEDLKKAITRETILVSIMMANNEVGTIEPIRELAKISQERGIAFHTDAVQAVGKIKVDVKKLGVDFLSLSGHKIYGPKGIGVLYIKKGRKIEPLITGGHHEKNLRAGTENVPAIVGLGEAAKIARKEWKEESERIKNLRDKLEKGILERIPYVRINGHPQYRLPNTLNVSFEYVEGESIILNLDLEGIAVSSGSACTSGTLEPSHVLMAMGVPAVTAQGSVRFSLGKDNREEDIDYLLEVLPPIIERLRKMSPLYSGK